MWWNQVLVHFLLCKCLIRFHSVLICSMYVLSNMYLLSIYCQKIPFGYIGKWDSKEENMFLLLILLSKTIVYSLFTISTCIKHSHYNYQTSMFTLIIFLRFNAVYLILMYLTRIWIWWLHTCRSSSYRVQLYVSENYNLNRNSASFYKAYRDNVDTYYLILGHDITKLNSRSG